MKPPRDSQRSRVYAADAVVNETSPRLETVDDINNFITRVLAKAPLQRRYGDHLKGVIRVHDGRGRRAACGDYGYIKMPVWSRTELIVLHEIAHTITTRRYGDRVAIHGREYCAIYLDLVRFGIGRETHDALKAAFTEHRVRFRPKRGATPVRVNPPMHAPALKVVSVVKPPATPQELRARQWAADERKRQAKVKREFMKIARARGFTFEIEREHGTRLAWIKTSPFGPFARGIETMHMDWHETIDRFETCLANPAEVDAGGGYSR